MAARTTEIALRGAGGEPVDLRRTIASHGVADLPPNRIDEDARAIEVTLLLDRASATTIRISPGRKGHAKVEPLAGNATAAQLRGVARQILRLDEDLSPFYAAAASDPDLSWAVVGAGRMIRSPSVFEDVVKTICTTNCTWSATIRMVSALVEHLGVAAPGPTNGPLGRAFPTPAAMARKNGAFYTETVRAGYRGEYLRSLARSVASGKLDLEALGTASADELHVVGDDPHGLRTRRASRRGRSGRDGRPARPRLPHPGGHGP